MGCSISQENGNNAQLPSQRFQVLEELGQGSRGKVQRVVEKETKQEYMEKIIENLPKDIDLAKFKDSATKSFQKLKQFKHNNLVSYQSFYLKNNQIHLVMELSKKGSLEQMVKKNNHLNENTTALLTKQILQGLKYLHNSNVLHLNLKPRNVLIFEDQKVKVSDYLSEELLNIYGDQDKGSGFKWNNFPFMAPQMVKNIGKTQLSDVWSVGCLVIYMLSGKLPWEQLGSHSQIFKELTSMTVPPLPFGRTVSCKNFLQSCLHIIPSQRSTVNQLLKHPFLTNLHLQKETKQQKESKYYPTSKRIATQFQSKKLKTNPNINHMPFSKKIILDDNVIQIGAQEINQQFSHFQPTDEHEPNTIILNNRKMKISPYRYHKDNRLSTEETEWITPSRARVNTLKQKPNIQGQFDYIEGYRHRSEFKHYEPTNSQMRVETQPNQHQNYDRQFFKRPLKLIKKKLQQKKEEASFERKLSSSIRNTSNAQSLSKVDEQNDLNIEYQLSRANSRSNHEELVIDTEITRAQRNKKRQRELFNLKKRQQYRHKWQLQLSKGRQLLVQTSGNRYYMS